MVNVAIDAMGGDYAPLEIVRGAVAALSANKDLNVILVGRQEKLAEVLNGLDYPKERLSIVHAAEVIESSDDPGLAMRGKKQSSMAMALQMAHKGKADAVLSAGNTGALMSGAILFLGRLSGVSRPALLTTMPSFSEKPLVLLDVGANMDARAEQMLQYAFMGIIYTREILGQEQPRVALLNVGTEANKGNTQVKTAYNLFQEYIPHFCGNIEGTELFFGQADVVVCDGFVGNVLLKITEGLGRGFMHSLKREAAAGFRNRLGAALLYPALRSLRLKLDPSEYGGAPLVGVNGVCIKCHGSSKARAIQQALLKQAYPLVRNNINSLYQEALLKIAAVTKGEGSNVSRV